MNYRSLAVVVAACSIVIGSASVQCSGQTFPAKYAKYTEKQRIKLLTDLVGKGKQDVVDLLGPPTSSDPYVYSYNNQLAFGFDGACNTMTLLYKDAKGRSGWDTNRFTSEAGKDWVLFGGAGEPETVAVNKDVLKLYDPRTPFQGYRHVRELLFIRGKTTTGAPLTLYICSPVAGRLPVTYTKPKFSVATNQYEVETIPDPKFDWKKCLVGAVLLGAGDPISLNFGSYTSFNLPKPPPAPEKPTTSKPPTKKP